MNASTAIKNIDESLHNLLREEMVFDVPVTLLAPDETGAGQRINLFLYKVCANPHLVNADWQVKPGKPERLVPPPLSLNLYYLMTPYSPNDNQLGNAAAHKLLGDAMRVLAQFPVVPEPYLAGDLTASREQIRIMHNGLDVEELSQVWSTFSRPFRLSVLYEVSVVQLEMDGGERDLAPRVGGVGAPGVGTGYWPPVVERMELLRDTEPDGNGAQDGVATLRFSGRHLAGHKAWVRLPGDELAAGLKLTEDTFDVVVPGDLQGGPYEARADRSNLFRRNFLSNFDHEPGDDDGD